MTWHHVRFTQIRLLVLFATFRWLPRRIEGLQSLIRATAGPGIREGEYGKAVGRGVLRGRAPGIIEGAL